MNSVTVADIMTKEVISVGPEMPLFDAAKIIIDYNFNGVPVVDSGNKLIGILTEYDLISKGSAVHLPTFQKLLKEINVLGHDKVDFNKEFSDIISLRVKDVMNPEPLILKNTASYEDTVVAFRDHHRVNPIPVVNEDNVVVGVVSRFDVLKPLHNLGNIL